MPSRRTTRSISGPIVFGSVSVALAIALLIGWIYVILQNKQNWVENLWLLVSGVASFAMIMTVLVLFSVFLALQILEIRRQTTFVDSVTHELRSPLASLRLCLQTLGREDLASRQREQLREMMLDDIERLSAFIDDILEANRIEHGSQNRARGHVSLAPLAERCASIVRKRHKIPDDGISLDIDPALALETDVTALEAILKNLLDNAVKYSDPPIAVRLQARQDSSGVTIIDVIDSGVGIPAQDLKRVFDRFYRVDNEAIRSRRGTGLGLFVVRALVRSLRGRLRAHSDGLGRGTRMSIELPHSAPPPSNGDQPFSASAPNT